MPKRLRHLALATLALLSAALTPANAARAKSAAIKPFEGTATIKVTHDRVGTHVFDYKVKSSRLRTELEVSEGVRAVTIVDFFKNEVFVLLPGQPLFVTMSLENSAQVALGHNIDTVTIEPTRARKKILGYRCTKYLVRDESDAFEVWATDQLGSFMGLGLAAEADAKFAPPWVSALAGKGFFPLRVQSLPGSKNTLSMETLSVQQNAQADDLFVPPPSYREFQVGGLVEDLLGSR
ncbi:hypothetical protein AXK12_06725 [Cephaloticoccus capnophilus]|uniref:DUF4412 domain-containing protein n=1 Tax=Cephaloticoccus capnophilus TaxID=1548208 RepID=A0A139SK11_9BACT|nr:DUF4412 domain-containing protein [Cephaloticoccus capnophilus]KXU34918.1 hypothetical protein AXK12_06725 [Cephaloticoccus capnophilus]